MSSRPHYDVAIIGAGLSGLAAGIRAAHFGRSVCIFERHNVAGGLNSFYSVDGRKFDVGLHAITNFVGEGVKGTPLGKILRQLRIDRDQLKLREQLGSRVVFGGQAPAELKFGNAIELLESEIGRAFPAEIDGFRRLVKRVQETAFDPDAPRLMARAVFGEYLRDPLLQEMLLCPLMFYGSAHPDDFPFGQAALMFSAIYLEGLARPAEGIRLVLRILLDRYRELGGERRMKCGVRAIVTEGNRAVGLRLDDGSEVTAGAILSSAGGPETAQLLGQAAAPRPGEISYVETMSVFSLQPAALGWNDTIVFFNDSQRFDYRRPAAPVDTRSGVICLPNNFRYDPDEQPKEGMLRVTCLADHAAWFGAGENYAAMKARYFPEIQNSARRFLPAVPDATLEAATVTSDMFTPRTVERFTGHRHGAIYGSPDKSLRGEIGGLTNLHLCGTDQGLLGIVGSMLSGITMANQHLLAS